MLNIQGLNNVRQRHTYRTTSEPEVEITIEKSKGFKSIVTDVIPTRLYKECYVLSLKIVLGSKKKI